MNSPTQDLVHNLFVVVDKMRVDGWWLCVLGLLLKCKIEQQGLHKLWLTISSCAYGRRVGNFLFSDLRIFSILGCIFALSFM